MTGECRPGVGKVGGAARTSEGEHPEVEISRLRRAVADLEEKASLYSYLFDNLNDAAFIIGREGDFLDVNQAAVDRLGYSRQEFLAMRPQAINDGEHAAGVAGRMGEVFLQGSMFFETVHVARDGRRIPAEISARRIRFKDTDAILALARDISDRRKAEESLRESERRYRDLFENASDAIFILDKFCRYREVNRKAVEIFGFSREEFLGMTVYDVIPPQQVARSGEEFRKLPEQGEYDHFVGKMRTKDDRWLDIEVSSTAIFENGIWAGSRDIVRDITDRTRVEEELRAAKEAAETANVAKSQFVANMSHEIRTPLGGLLGLLAMLEHGPLDTERKRYLDLAKVSGERLLQVINDVLDFAKIEAKKLDMEERCFPLRRTVEETVAIFLPRAETKGLLLRCNLGEGLPGIVCGDPGRLSQILLNLLDNAIKFTEQGEIRLSIDLGKTGDGEVELLFCVRDTGIGVPPANQADIFSAFTQVDGSHSRRHGGTGLGLAISSQLAAMMGGSMWLQSPPADEATEQSTARGSAFFFTVRLRLQGAAGEESAMLPLSEEVAEEPLHGRVLLAEDDFVNRMLATALLEKLGLEVVQAVNGHDALEKIAGDRFDLVLMDVQMPEMDGFEATRAIRGLEAGREGRNRLPIIALTAHAMQGDRERCLASGMDDYLAKPIATAEIRRMVRNYLQGEK
ncbi:MAG: PAS domain S-box protein [Thermodesulfobacteriota bacterium]